MRGRGTQTGGLSFTGVHGRRGRAAQGLASGMGHGLCSACSAQWMSKQIPILQLTQKGVSEMREAGL